MENIDRRTFLKKSTAVSAGVMVSAPAVAIKSGKKSPNDTINVAVIGVRSRGRDHYRALAKIPNVNIAVLCDIDQKQLAEASAEVKKLTGTKPVTESEYRKVLDKVLYYFI